VLLSPIAFLVAMVLKPNPMATTKSLWCAAVILFVLKLWYLEASPPEATACFIKGCLQAITPCSIVAGAIFLFDAMESSQCLAWMKVQLRVITNSHPVAEVMLIGFCFAFIVEGASGFGTPAALAAPMLYSMGHEKLECVICLLAFNTFMTVFGAVGTPVWFGVGEVVDDFTEDDLLEVGFTAAIGVGTCAILVVPYVVWIIVPWEELRPSLLFIVLSTLSVVLPFLAFSFVTYEFPTMAAGIVGLCITAGLTLAKIGLGPHNRGEPGKKRNKESSAQGGIPDMSGVPPAETDAPITKPSADAPQKEASAKIPPIPDKKSAGSQGDDNPRRNNSVHSTRKEVSSPELQELAVNDEVRLSKKDVKKMTKGDGMCVAPAAMVTLVDDDGDVIADEFAVAVNDEGHDAFVKRPTVLQAILRTMPLWLTVVLLIVTRLEPIGLKDVLREDTPTIVDGNLGTLGHLSISTVGRFRLSKILGTNLSWTYELLYTPFILPFVVAGIAPLLVFYKELETPPLKIVSGVITRIKGPCLALSGAMFLVELLRTSDALKDSPAIIIGTRLSETLSDGFVVLSFPLGALGSFFSGSTTVSMLTFTQVQKVAAEELGLSPQALIGLQLVGASAGNAFCLSNIIAATAVIGLHISEGVIIKRVLLPVFAMYVIATAVLMPFVYA